MGESGESVWRERGLIDYWRRVHGNPGMVEIVMLFGVPLKMIYDGHNTYQAKVVESSGPNSSFQVPAGYKKLDN